MASTLFICLECLLYILLLLSPYFWDLSVLIFIIWLVLQSVIDSCQSLNPDAMLPAGQWTSLEASLFLIYNTTPPHLLLPVPLKQGVPIHQICFNNPYYVILVLLSHSWLILFVYHTFWIRWIHLWYGSLLVFIFPCSLNYTCTKCKLWITWRKVERQLQPLWGSTYKMRTSNQRRKMVSKLNTRNKQLWEQVNL